jgi:hypothetical protein
MEVLQKPVVRWHGVQAMPGCICSGANDPDKLAYEAAWSFVENIFCICLRERGDRLAEASDQFHARGLCRRVIFYRPERPSAEDLEAAGVQCRGLFGVWTSHATVALRAACMRSSRTLVFEDDVLFHAQRTSPLAITEAGNRLNDLDKSNTRWEVFYLGHVPFFSVPVAKDLGLFRTFSMMAHAYILSAPAAAKLASRDYASDMRLNGAERGIDNWLCRDFIQYAPRYQFVVQSGSRSSNLQNTAAVNDYWYDIVVPFGIEAHRDYCMVFEAFTFFLVPILLLCLLAWASQSRLRAAGLIMLLATIWLAVLFV